MKLKHQPLRFYLLLFFTLIIGKINAQQTLSRLTLEGCIDYALRNNLKIRQVDLEQKESQYRISEVKSKMLPQVSGSGLADRNLVIPTMILPGELVGTPGTKIAVQMGAKNVLDFSIQLEQVIYDPSLFVGLKIARTDQELYQLRGLLTEDEMIYNVSHVFYGLMGSSEELKDIDTMLSKQQSLAEIVHEKVIKGVSRQVDLNRIQVNINNLKLKRKKIENTVFQQNNYLKTLIGMPVEEVLRVDYHLSTSETTPNSLISTLDSSHVELDILEKKKEMIDYLIRQEKNKYLPTLSGLVSGGYQFQSDQLRLTKDPWYNSVAVGLRLNIPIFDGFAKRNKIQQYHFQKQNLDFQMREMQQNIVSNKLNAISQLNVSLSSIEDQKQNLLLAEDNYNKTNLLYNEGLIDIIDVFETETTLLDTKIAFTRELINHKKAEVDLLKALGKLKALSKY